MGRSRLPPGSWRTDLSLQVVVLATAYFVAGRIALLISEPPHFAMTVWPAAGIALAALLMYGYRLWPGVWLGSFAVNLVTKFDPSSAGTAVESVVAPVGIAAGATVQALLGAWLVRRFAGFPSRLDRPGNLLYMMAAGGPLACVVSASFACVFLLQAGRVDVEGLGGLALTWWFGDTVGVLLVLPLASEWTREMSRASRRARLRVAVPIALAALVTVVGFLFVRTSERDQEDAEFRRRAETALSAVETTVEANCQVVTDLAGVFATMGDGIDRKRFGELVKPTLERRREDLQALGWNWVVTWPEIPSFEASARDGRHPDFYAKERTGDDFVPVRERDYPHVVVRYIEPYEGNEKALGYDIASNPDRREALQAVVDTQEVAITPPIHLVQEDGEQPGFLLFAPVWKRSPKPPKGTHPHSYAVGVFRAGDMLAKSLGTLSDANIGFRVVDARAQEKPLFESGAAKAVRWSRDIPVAGRTWTVGFWPTAAYAAGAAWTRSWFALTGGLLCTCLLGIYLLLQAGRSAATARTNEALRLRIKERRQAQEALRRSEARMQEAQKLESLGVLAGGIAHDFNNILTSMLGHADLALEELPESSPVRGRLERIETATRRAADLCQQMLAYSGRGQFVLEPVDLGRTVTEMAGMLKASVTKGAELEYELADELPSIRADATQMRQVVLNLVTNASEALDGGGEITVRTGVTHCSELCERECVRGPDVQPGPRAYVEVSDTGCGMGPDVLERLFEPFFTTKFTGRGLGMAALQGIVRGHQGGIRVRSRLGHGTNVRVCFPVVDGHVERTPSASERDTRKSNGARILLVDDEQGVREIAASMLEALGHESLAAENGETALALFREQHARIDGVLLDLTMPGMSGKETCRALRRIDASVPVILSSGYSGPAVMSNGEADGFACFIQKPYKLKALRAALAHALGARSGAT